MFSMIRKRLTYANVAMTIALVFAMSGGAYAAKRYLITSTKQINPKVLKQLTGKTGPAGPAGKVGAPGLAGKDGVNGKDGANGTSGANGTNGVSVASKELTSKDSACNKEGGAEFTAASGKSLACNGKEGSPWTAGGTLPSGKTETGVWVYQGVASEKEEAKATALSFPIPLNAGVTKQEIVRLGETPGEGCEGGTVEDPKAKPGNLCIFEGEVALAHKGNTRASEAVNPSTGAPGSGLSGAELLLFVGKTVTGEISAEGTWAVTAE